MSELWCDYEARTEWPGLNFETAEEDSNPNIKRRRSRSKDSRRDQRDRETTRKIVEAVEECECDIQYYEGDQNRTYSSSINSFIPTGAEIWPRSITEYNSDADSGLSREAISFLNAQNDYFGPGGEYIADRIEQDFDLRWDYKRARQLCIAHLNVEKMTLIDLYFALSRGIRLISFWLQFESLEKPTQVAWTLGGQAGHQHFPEFYLYWRPDMAGPHVQLQTGSLSGGNIPQGILWPRRWWREALRRRNAIQECRSLNGPDSILKISKLFERAKKHIERILVEKNVSIFDQVLQRSCSRALPEVSKKIQSILGRVFERDTIRNDRQIVNFGHQFHQPNEIFKLSQKRYGQIDFSSVRQMTLDYFCLHEYLCSTAGAARLKFCGGDLARLVEKFSTSLSESENYFGNL